MGYQNWKIWIQVQNVDYSQAIDRYNYLRTRFFNEYSIAANIEEREAKQHFYENIVEDINTSPIKDQEALVSELFQQIEETIKSRIKGDSKFQKNRKNVKKLYKDSKTKGKKMAEELGESLITEKELETYVKNQLKKMSVGGGFSINDILNQVKGYRNKVVLSRTNASASRYIRSTKGYFREALVYKAFSKMEEKIGQLPVLSTGDAKVNGKDTLYDTYISFLKNFDLINFQDTVKENIDVGYGIQSKSWVAPWELSNEKMSYFNEKYGFSVGNRAGLLSDSGLQNYPGNLYFWMRGVIYLEQHAIEAIGENQLGFITGNNFYWTKDLIELFRAMNYFLAFGYNGKKSLSPSVSWRTVPSE